MPDASPYLSLSRHQPARVSSKSSLLALSRTIEARALASAPEADLWVSLQHVRFYTGLTRQLHENLAKAGVRVHVYGVGVRGISFTSNCMSKHEISEFGYLAHEWNVLLVTPDAGLGLAARQLDPAGVTHFDASKDAERKFEWVLSENRADVVYATAALPTASFILGNDFTSKN